MFGFLNKKESKAQAKAEDAINAATGKKQDGAQENDEAIFEVSFNQQQTLKSRASIGISNASSSIK